MSWLGLAALRALTAGATFLTLGYALFLGIGPLPTSRKVAREVVQLLPADMKRFYELGSGIGAMALLVARQRPSCEVIACELSPVPYLISKLRKALGSYPNLTLTREDIFTLPLASESLLFCYLYPGAMEKLKERLTTHDSPPLSILTHTFAIHGWSPSKVVYATDLYRTPIYLYQTHQGQTQPSSTISTL